ncbi:hypothetical protein PPUJ20028_32970 [Pseudomonas putida]|uniref:DUF1833 domain-containing protein n=1 Tax=Pseudomonas putida TaxID=303 RepID=A0AA37RIP9_PSEPU|nr:DUF1833 family protein [Pseudomonas putida]GLO14714.1 hypothetical protein PPUJ20028_32970 [Pseudomonas putida]GLO34919.1 hypothetical protein PPUN14671_17520 [Pseudomonas putida]HDS0963597.1 DUF1833 family protein [Pseudomonas putida]HDS0988856.1 DUF1833 family protein [Pseudomonas putida]
MTAIATLYASGGRAWIIPTIELRCVSWPGPVYICSAFEDLVATTEDGVLATFTAAAFDAALPKRDNSGNQSLTFAIDNVTGVAQQLIDQALEARQKINMIFRTYLSSDLSAPAEKPYRMNVLSGFMEGATVQLQAGYFDFVNLAWPRRKYTLDFVPALRYT